MTFCGERGFHLEYHSLWAAISGTAETSTHAALRAWLIALDTLVRMVTARMTRQTRFRGFIVGVTVITALIGVSGCTTEARQPVHSPPVATEQPDAPVTSAPEFVADGSATDNLPFFANQLNALAAGDTPIEGQPIVDAIVQAGFDRNDMQVSFDQTRTHLVADFIFVSVRMGESCLLGQISTGDRSVSAVVEPAVGPEGNICLIGQTRPIDW